MLTENHHKKRKLLDETPQEEQGEDRISQLPDEILHKILTLLVTKQAVMTRVVSKRWNSLWTAFPVLELGPPSSDVTSSRLLMEFLDNYVLNHNDNASIDKFSLQCNKFFNPSRILPWLSYIMRHRIQHLSLIFDTPPTHSPFPTSFYTCNSLKVLKLEVKCHFKLPSSFPNLTNLSIKGLTFSDEDHVRRLFSNSPFLEKLEVRDCNWVNVSTINISSPMLNVLILWEDPWKVPFGLCNCEIDIVAPNITTFMLGGSIPKCFASNYIRGISIVDINSCIEETFVREMNADIQGRILKLLTPLSHAQLLVIDNDLGQILFQDERLLNQRKVPTFICLLSLSLNWFNDTLPSTTLFNMLQTMPFLRKLSVDKARFQFVDDDSSTLASLPQCLLYYLMYIEFSEITGDPGDLDIIELFLKNARALEKMIVSIDAAVETEKRELVLHKLNMIPITSQKAHIQITEN